MNCGTIGSKYSIEMGKPSFVMPTSSSRAFLDATRCGMGTKSAGTVDKVMQHCL